MADERASKDVQFAELLNAEGRSCSLWVEDGREQLIVHPRGYPPWFVVLCVALPVGIGAAYVMYQAMHNAIAPLEVMAVAFGCLAAIFIVAVFLSANRSMAAMGPFCILDKGGRTLHLPRADLRLRASEIDGFVEVRTWHVGKARREPIETWLGELNVLVRAGQGEVARFSVACCMNTRPLHRLAKDLAGFFGVPVVLQTVDRKMLARLRSEGRGGAELAVAAKRGRPSGFLGGSVASGAPGG